MPIETDKEPNKIVPIGIAISRPTITYESLYTHVLFYSHNKTQSQTFELVAPLEGLLLHTVFDFWQTL